MSALGTGLLVRVLAAEVGMTGPPIHICLILMAKGGYDPAVGFWEKEAPGFLINSPSDDETRTNQIKQWLPEAHKY